VAKRLISQNNKNQISLNEEQVAMGDLISLIQTLGIGLVDADQITTDIFGRPKIFSAAGDIVRVSVPFYGKDNWKMIKSVDSLTITIAILIGANLFATFDEGFKGLRNQHITPLIIQDAYTI
jgi:hypothetical protein